MWAAATEQPAAGLPGRHRRAAEGEEHLLGDVLGLVPRAQHAGGHADDPLVVAAEDLLQVGAHVTSGRTRHPHAFLPLVPPPRGTGARSGAGQHGRGRRSSMPNQVHVSTAPPGSEM